MTNYEHLLSDEETLAAFLVNQNNDINDMCQCCSCCRTRTRYGCVKHAEEYGADCEENIYDWLISRDKPTDEVSRFERFRSMSVRQFAERLAQWDIKMGGFTAPYSWEEIIRGNVEWLEQEAETE